MSLELVSPSPGEGVLGRTGRGGRGVRAREKGNGIKPRATSIPSPPSLGERARERGNGIHVH